MVLRRWRKAAISLKHVCSPIPRVESNQSEPDGREYQHQTRKHTQPPAANRVQLSCVQEEAPSEPIRVSRAKKRKARFDEKTVGKNQRTFATNRFYFDDSLRQY